MLVVHCMLLSVTLPEFQAVSCVSRARLSNAFGRVADEYRAALAEHGLQAFMGDCAAVQPGRLSDLMLHETAVSWIRSLLAITLPARPWEESPQQHISRLKRVAGQVNADYGVAGLCRELPARVEELVRRGGGKLRK